MERDVIVDGDALSAVEGKGIGFDEAFDRAFEEFRDALNTAHRVGSVRTMRVAVEAYDRFEKVARNA